MSKQHASLDLRTLIAVKSVRGVVGQRRKHPSRRCDLNAPSEMTSPPASICASAASINFGWAAVVHHPPLAHAIADP